MKFYGKMTLSGCLLVLAFLAVQQCTDKSQVKDPVKEEGWVEATGVGTIKNGEIGKAKDDALDDAKLSAVKQVLGTLIQGRVEVDSGVFQSSELTAKTEGFIENYKVLSQKAVSEHEYQVKIHAKVSKAKLEAVLEDLINRMGRPRMMAILDEEIVGKKTEAGQSVAGTEIESIFTEKGFPFVDKSTVENLLRKQQDKIRRALGGNNDILKELGVDAGAEVVLAGNSKVTNAGFIAGSKMISMQADVSIRIIDVNTGLIIGAYQEHAAAAHINENTGAVLAIKKAVAKASEKSIDIIAKKWKRGKSQTIEILIIGMDYEKLKTFASELTENIRGVKAVNRKGSAGQAAKLQVEFDGQSFTLADRISEGTFSTKVKIGEVKPGSIEIQAK